MTYSLYLSHLKSVKMQSFELESGISSCFVLICSNLIGSQLKWATEVNLKKILKVNLLKKWVGNGLKMYFRAQKCSWPKEPFFGLAAFNYSMRFAPSEKGKSLESHGVLTPILHSLWCEMECGYTQRGVVQYVSFWQNLWFRGESEKGQYLLGLQIADFHGSYQSWKTSTFFSFPPFWNFWNS